MVDYSENWRKYRRLVWLFWASLLGYAALLLLAVFLDRFNYRFDGWFLMFAIALAACWLVLGARINRWRCPRCGKWFSATWWYHLFLFARKCVHCGLPKYANHG